MNIIKWIKSLFGHTDPRNQAPVVIEPPRCPYKVDPLVDGQRQAAIQAQAKAQEWTRTRPKKKPTPPPPPPTYVPTRERTVVVREQADTITPMIVGGLVGYALGSSGNAHASETPRETYSGGGGESSGGGSSYSYDSSSSDSGGSSGGGSD